jgi:outer membrane protein assembly factor BamB
MYASPALSNDNSRVYIACYNAGMFGLNRQTGKIDWTTPLKNVMSSPAVVRPTSSARCDVGGMQANAHSAVARMPEGFAAK